MDTGQKRKFRTPTLPHVPDSPEALFGDLRARASEIKHLWAHQADLLREYHRSFMNHSDVAFQLPTGSGKTLIGLLIGEYRRIAREERVVYLCPTRQLAHQVGHKAEGYGISARVLVGSHQAYRQEYYAEYVMARAQAITTYSSLFNVKPRFDDAQIIILDDVHAAENYVMDMWTLSIGRSSTLYRAILSLFSESLPPATLSHLQSSEYDPFVDKVPLPCFQEKGVKLAELLDARIDELDTARFAWSCIRDHLPACHLFVSWPELNIRPIFPPTLTHAPFAQASQRLYMSATLGHSGVLERSVGVPTIKTIPANGEWDRQAIGRRLILFPDAALDQGEAVSLAYEAIVRQPRSLVISPDKVTHERFTAGLRQTSPRHSIMTSKDIEESLDPFIKARRACLALHGRFDGLDLPDEACRLLVITGLPHATNLQERFLWSRLNATAALRDRVRTRLMQALGRCTRHAADYAAIIMVGQDLFDFCAKGENLHGANVEVRAEIQFGLDNSREQSPKALLSLMGEFYKQGDDWTEADSDILTLRDRLGVSHCQISPLADTHDSEVQYVYSLWKTDYMRALELARDASDRLSGENLKGYRGWWYYLAGGAAWLAGHTSRPDLMETARDMFERASKCTLSCPWLVQLSQTIGRATVTRHDAWAAVSSASTSDYVTSLGLTGIRFDKRMKELMDHLEAAEADTFANGLVELGRALGFEACRPPGPAAPDAVWLLGQEVLIAFEAKTECTATGISIETLRQANGHRNWANAHLRDTSSMYSNEAIVVITPQKAVHKDAVPYAGTVCYLSTGDVRNLGESVIGVLRRARSCASDKDSLSAQLAAELSRAGLTPKKILERLVQCKVSELPSS